MRRMVTGGMLMGMLAASVIEGAGVMGSYRPNTHKHTSRESQDEDKQRAEEKRQRRKNKRKQQVQHDR